MPTLHNKTALVTGASRGIGAAITERLARDGATVVVNYQRNAGAAEDVVARITAAGGQALAIQADLTDATQLQQLFDRTLATYGQLDILVNSAGARVFGPVETISLDGYQRVFDLNVRTVLLATQHAVRAFGITGGRIINISSGITRDPPVGASVYAAAKAAADTLTRALAKELGPRGITVNSIAPGITDTESLSLNAQGRAALIERTPLRRIGQPADIADAVAFFASDAARWITGEVISVGGGL